MSRVGCSAGKSGDLSRKTSGGAKDELPVCRYARAIFERDVGIRLRAEYERSAFDDRAARTDHRIIDLQPAAIRCLKYAVVGDDGTRFECESAAAEVGVDCAVRPID